MGGVGKIAEWELRVRHTTEPLVHTFDWRPLHEATELLIKIWEFGRKAQQHFRKPSTDMYQAA